MQPVYEYWSGANDKIFYGRPRQVGFCLAPGAFPHW
jgi:hypothetical protein